MLEDARVDGVESISTRVSIVAQQNNNIQSEDENEIDLRERLLREKAIKSMRRRQLTNNNNDTQPRVTTDRFVYETQ